MEPTLSPSDHDLLIELRTEMRGMRDDFKKGADDVKERLIILGANKLEKDEFHAWQVAHEKETVLREQALEKQTEDSFEAAMKIAKDQGDSIKALQKSDEAQGKQLQYIAGGLVVFGIILSIVGPLITGWLGHLLHLN